MTIADVCHLFLENFSSENVSFRVSHNLGSLEAQQRRARRGHKTIQSSNAMAGKKARAREKKGGRRDANAANAGEAFPRLPNHLVVTHILRSEYFDDDADLARLPAVSRAMRDLVAETGLRFEELDEKRAVELGCVSAVQRMQRQGRLSRQELLCQAAARSGQLAELKVLRADGWPWDQYTCSAAALGGHLEVLQWARANGCPWNIRTCHAAAEGGHLKVLLWARKNGCPCDETELHIAALNGQVAMVRALIKLGADVNKATDNGWTPKNGCPCDETELHIAALNGQVAMVRALIKLGADVNKARDTGATLLCAAAHQGHETVLRALIEAGADVNKATDNGWTPKNGCPCDETELHIAALNGQVAMVRALIEAGADVNKAADDGVTPLLIAAHQGHEMVVRALIEAGADVNKTWDHGVTPLLIAAEKGPRGDSAGAGGVGHGHQQGDG
jgi:hypothetical protein